MLKKKTTALDKRLQKIEKELALVNDDIKYLSRSVENPARGIDLNRLTSIKRDKRPEISSRPLTTDFSSEGLDASIAEQVAKRRYVKDSLPHDEKLADFLSGSFETMRPLRHERRIQRNKAFLMIFFVLILLVWLVFRFMVH